MSPPRLAPLSIGRWRSHIPWPRRLLPPARHGGRSHDTWPAGAHPWLTPLVRSGHGGRCGTRYRAISCAAARTSPFPRSLRHLHAIPFGCWGKSEGQGSKGRGTPIRSPSPAVSHVPVACHLAVPRSCCPGPYYRRPGKVVGRVLTCPPHTHGPTAAATSGSDRYRARSPAGRWLHRARCWDVRMSCRVPEWRHR